MTDKEVKDKQGNNALYYASFFGHAHIVAELGKKEVPYEISDNGTSCLHVAALRGHLDVVEVFLNYKNLISHKAHHPWDNTIDVNLRKPMKGN